MKKYVLSIPDAISDCQAAGCETVPEPPLVKAKIIPFPGVSLSEPDCFQDEVDIFLQEMGYMN